MTQGQAQPQPHYPSAVPAYDWIAYHARVDPQKLAQVDVHSGRRWTYGQMHDRVERCALFLKQGCGIGRGDRVAVLAPNTTDTFEVQFACQRLGAIFLPLNWRLTVFELEYIIGDATPDVLVYDRSFADQAAEVAKRCNTRVTVEIDGDDRETAYEKGLAAATGTLAPVALTHGDIWTIMYTSGTTGHPKGAIITYGMTFWNAVNMGMAHLVGPETVGVTVLPLFHTGGLNLYANPCFHCGGTSYVVRAFDPALCLKLIGDPSYGVTHFFGVPANYQFMMQHPDFDTTDLSRLKIAGIGGAPAAHAILEKWTGRGVAMPQGYGMTETSPSAMSLAAKDAATKLGSAGKPLLHTEMRLVDENGVDITTPDTVGEIWVRGPHITPGYWNNPEANARSFTDGWLHTGDAATVDADGFWTIVDRWKDMYISGGENVYPAEVENVIYQIDGITEAAVIGVPDDKWGEVGKAIIVPKAGANITAERVIDHCTERLAKFKVPKYVDFIEALPRNATGKVLKRDLRDAD